MSHQQHEQRRLQQQQQSSFNSLSPVSPPPPLLADYVESASSSSLSNTDSDYSLRSSRSASNGPARQQVPSPKTDAASGKSAILIKYNYYDYNGGRQEQANHDMNYQQQAQDQQKRLQRQFSPTFKQNLNQIIKNSLLNNNNNKNRTQAASPFSPSPASPSPISPELMQPQQQQPVGNFNLLNFSRRYKLSSYEQFCLRCKKTVYQMDKVGPLKDFTFYHQNCFKCRECGTKLTLKTYFNNQQSSGDQEVYCHRHCPKTGPGRLDNQSVGIRAALNAPKVFDLTSNQAMGNLNSNQPAGQVNYQLINCDSPNGPILSPTSGYVRSKANQLANENCFNNQAANVQVPNKLQNIYMQSQVDKKISQFLNKRLEFLEPKQKLLEMRHREEEDALFKAFDLKWRQEEKSISEQIKLEWQLELSKLLDKYKRQLNEISLSQPISGPKLPPEMLDRQTRLLLNGAGEYQEKYPNGSSNHHSNAELKGQPNAMAGDFSKQQMIEFERLNLEKTMTIKLDRKKETLKRKLKEFERQATAELVEKQSREMLALISIKLDEYKEEQKRKIGSDLEQFEAIESLANQLGSSLQLTAGAFIAGQDADRHAPLELKRASAKGSPNSRSNLAQGKLTPNENNNNLRANLHMMSPPPRPPLVSKMELYNGEEPDVVFKDIDQLAINVARGDQQTFTDLVHHLTRYCLTDIEKVRAIFRWITVKNLNTMQFDSSVKPDTPLGLLRGIKNGSESYHVLFKRLCSYAGLHCVVIKGFSKSAGYQPGVRFESNRFRNSWNAVYVANSWRFVQCNWGARHLVSVAVMQDRNQSGAKAANPMTLNQLASPRLHANQQLPAALTDGQQAKSNHKQQQPNHGRRGLAQSGGAPTSDSNNNGLRSPNQQSISPNSSSSSRVGHRQHTSASPPNKIGANTTTSGKQQAHNNSNDSLRYEYDDHYFLTDPDEFIYEFFPLNSDWQLIKQKPISLAEFEQLPFVRSLFFKYGLYFPQNDIKSVLYTDTSGATTIKIGMPTHMIPSLIFHYNLKFYDSDLEHHDGISLKRFVMQSVESGTSDNQTPNGAQTYPNEHQILLSNIVSFRIHLPQNGSYILDIFANSTTPTQYITGEPMKFKSVCKFKIIAKNLKTVMIPLPDCASGEYGPMKATRLFGIIPITHESGLISVQNDKRFLEIQFRMTRPLLDFMASLHKNGFDEKQLSKSIKIFIDGDIVFITMKFFEDGQYGLDIYTRDQTATSTSTDGAASMAEPKKQLLTHCCKYLINVRTPANVLLSR